MTDKKTIIYDTFIKGNIIDLVVLTNEIVEKSNWYKWFNDEDTTKYMQKHYFPNTKNQQYNFFIDEIENSKNKLQLGILHIKDQNLIGIISLNDIDYINRNCEISGFIGERKYRSTKEFIEACKMIIKHGFEQLGLNKITGGTISKEVSILLLDFLKFSEEGILKDQIF